MVGYAIFCSVKCRQVLSSEDNKVSNKYFGMVVVGLLFGLVLGFFASPTLTEIIFTKNFLKTHSNPDETQKVLGVAKHPVITTRPVILISGISHYKQRNKKRR